MSLFIDPEKSQIEASKVSGAGIIEFHTGRYAEEFLAGGDHQAELAILKEMTEFALR